MAKTEEDLQLEAQAQTTCQEELLSETAGNMLKEIVKAPGSRVPPSACLSASSTGSGISS